MLIPAPWTCRVTASDRRGVAHWRNCRDVLMYRTSTKPRTDPRTGRRPDAKGTFGGCRRNHVTIKSVRRCRTGNGREKDCSCNGSGCLSTNRIEVGAKLPRKLLRCFVALLATGPTLSAIRRRYGDSAENTPAGETQTIPATVCVVSHQLTFPFNLRSRWDIALSRRHAFGAGDGSQGFADSLHTLYCHAQLCHG